MAGVTQIPATTALSGTAGSALSSVVRADNEHCCGDSTAFQRKLSQTEIRLVFPLSNKTETTLVLVNQTSKPHSLQEHSHALMKALYLMKTAPKAHC